MPPCTIPNSAWSARVRAARQRSAQAMGARHGRGDLPAAGRVGIDAAGRRPSPCRCPAPPGSPPRARASIAGSSRRGGERKSRPRRRRGSGAARLNTWNPPESVRIGPSQPMNRAARPALATRSSRAAATGDRCWPAGSGCRPCAGSVGVRPLTVAWVPTGMNAGVSTAPCGVSSRPSRARPMPVARDVKVMAATPASLPDGAGRGRCGMFRCRGAPPLAYHRGRVR